MWDARDEGQWFLEIGFRSFAQDLATREGESQKPSLSRKSLPNFSTNESYGVSQSMLKRRMQVCDDFLSRRNIKISQEVV